MQIKLRVWDKINKKMYHHVGISINGVQIYEADTFPEKLVLDSGMDNFDLLLWTGLYDKHHNPIYEGDIVKDRFNRIMKIGIWNYRMCFIAITETNFHHADFYDWLVDRDMNNNRLEVEIIGNEFENPELLKINNEVDI